MKGYGVVRGYNVQSGYMGWIGDRYILFSCERDYKEWCESHYDWYE